MVNAFSCIWDVVNFAFVEHLISEAKYKNNILVIVRFTHDMLIVWKKLKNNQTIEKILKGSLIRNQIQIRFVRI